jgi:hypothetical protein
MANLGSTYPHCGLMPDPDPHINHLGSKTLFFLSFFSDFLIYGFGAGMVSCQPPWPESWTITAL